MNAINFSQLREVLPNDVLNLLLSYLSPQIITQTSRKNRDDYFKKNTLVIDCEKISLIPELYDEFLSKYKITLVRYKEWCSQGYVNQIVATKSVIRQRNPIIFTQTTRVKICDADNLGGVLDTFTNLTLIEGIITTNTSNLKCLSRVNNNLLIDICSDIELFYYADLNLPNLVRIYPEISLSGKKLPEIMVNKIYCSPASILRENTTYQNLEIINNFIHDDLVLSKNIGLPKLRTIKVEMNITPEKLSNIMNKYHTITDIKMSSGASWNQSYNIYSKFAEFPASFWFYNHSNINKILEFETRYRSENPDKIRRKLIVLQHLYVDEYPISPELSNLFDFKFRNTIDYRENFI